LGFAAGNNIGIKKALSDKSVKYVALVNTDATLDVEWTTNIVELADKKPKGAIYQGTTLDYYDHRVVDSTHIYVSRNGQATQGNWRHYLTQEFGPKKVFGANAAACIISRRFIEAQPFDTYFDETLFMYLEDVDVAIRATVMGWDNYLVPAARAYHMGSASSGKNPGFSLYMTFRNNGAVLLKNYPMTLLWRMLPALVRGDIDTVKELRRRGQDASAWKVIKGRAIGVARLPYYIKMRRKMNAVRTIDTDYLWHLMHSGY
jgi:GT2 family glycosyltransferase